MFRRPHGAVAPWIRRRCRTPAARHADMQPDRSTNVGRVAVPSAGGGGVEVMQFDGQAVPPELVPSFQQVLAVADGLNRPRAPTSIHQVLRNSWIPSARSLDGPTPRQNLEMLREHKATGGDVGIT